jgi:hypothetical protein
MNKLLPLAIAALTVVLIVVGSVHGNRLAAASTPDAAVRAMYEQVKARDFGGAFTYVAKQSNTDLPTFQRDMAGRNASLRTYSGLQKVETRVLNENDQHATVRTNTEWSSAVGAVYDTRDLNVVKEDGAWKVLWPREPALSATPQVIPVNFLRWDIVRRDTDIDEWGAQNVEAPHMRVVSMNAVEKDNSVVVLGEVVNEDIVPGFVAINAQLVGKDGNTIAEESSFDKISHTLLPKEVSPFRIDFPGHKLAEIKSVRLNPNYLLVPASADPVIAAMHQRIEVDSRGRHVLRGELVNESGQIVNIPHVLATYYDDNGKVVWVSDGYVDHALLPQVPVPFAVDLRDDLAGSVHRYRVSINQYSIPRASTD